MKSVAPIHSMMRKRKIPNAVKLLIKQRLEDGENPQALAEEYNLNPTTLYKIRKDESINESMALGDAREIEDEIEAFEEALPASVNVAEIIASMPKFAERIDSDEAIIEAEIEPHYHDVPETVYGKGLKHAPDESQSVIRAMSSRISRDSTNSCKHSGVHHVFRCT